MGELKTRLASCRRALASLEEAVEMPFSVIVRDGCIQRFEYSFETTWKLLKTFLEEQEGILCHSAKGCFREALKAGLLTVEQTELSLEMTDDRNVTSHTYIEAVAEAIYRRIPSYLTVMSDLLAKIDEAMAEESLDE